MNPHLQFNLRFLFAATTSAAVATYALIYATPFWASLFFTLCIGLLLAAILFAIAASGRARFFWLGFAIFGWGYWLVLHSHLLAMGPATQNWRLDPGGPPPLLTNRYLIWIYNAVLPLVHEQPEPQQTATPQQPPPPPLTLGRAFGTSAPPFVEPPRNAFGFPIRDFSYPTEIEFMRVGHSLCAVLSALTGGAISLWAFWHYRPQERRGPTPTPPRETAHPPTARPSNGPTDS